MYCGVRFGLSLGVETLELAELAELFELVELVELVELFDVVETELGLVMTLDQGLLEVVGVALRLVVEDTDEAVGDGAPRWYHVGSSCRFTMDMVC